MPLDTRSECGMRLGVGEDVKRRGPGFHLVALRTRVNLEHHLNST